MHSFTYFPVFEVTFFAVEFHKDSRKRSSYKIFFNTTVTALNTCRRISSLLTFCAIYHCVFVVKSCDSYYFSYYNGSEFLGQP